MKLIIIIFILIPLILPAQNASSTNVNLTNSNVEFIRPIKDSITDQHCGYINPLNTSESLCKTITIDFEHKNTIIPAFKNHIKRGEPFKIKIINYNPYLYKVSIDHKDSTVSPVGDAQILTWFVDPTNLSSISAGLSALQITAASAINPPQEKFELNHISEENTTHSQKIFINKRNEMINKKKKFKEIIDGNKVIIKSQKNDILVLNKNISLKLYEYSKKINFLYELSPNSSHFKNIEKTINTLEKAYDTLRLFIFSKKVEITNLFDKYTDEVSSLADLTIQEINYKKADSLIRKFYSEADLSLNIMDSLVSYTELTKLTTVLNGIKSLSTTYTSLPLYFTDDIKKLSIQLIPWKDSLRLLSYNSSIEIPWSQHRIAGVSAGLYYSSLSNKGYSNKMDPNSTDTVYNLIEDNPSNKGEIGINAMAYIAWQIGTNNSFFIGPALGAGMSIENKPKPRIFIGPSILWGDKNKFALSLGLNLGYVQNLSAAYNSSSSYKSPQSGYMKDYLKTGFYLSVHYSFLK